VSSTAIHSYRFPTGKWYLSLTVKRTYHIRPGGRAEVAREQVGIVEKPVYADSTNEGAFHRLVHDTDRFCPEKPLTDVLVRGSAHSTRGPVASLIAAVEVGSAKKQVRVVGQRRIVLGAAGRLSFTSPEPFIRWPLLWDHAFGGRDAFAEAKLSDTGMAFGRSRQGLAALAQGMPNPKEGGYSLSYPRNISGRGFFVDIDRERIDGTALPNLEDPTDPVMPERLLVKDPLDWMDLPIAACFEPIDTLTFPRAVFMVPHAANSPKRPLHELSTGAILPADLADQRFPKVPPNPRLFNCAPAGLAVCRLSGGERVKLHHLHPKHESLEFDLPGERPRLLIEPPGCKAADLPSQLATIVIEPDTERVTLTWAGKLEVAAPFSEDSLKKVRHAATFGRD
jgi:hypothetical protein